MSYPTTFPADGPIDISVRQNSGDVTLTALDTAEVTVDVQASGPDADELIATTKVHYRSGSLRIEAPKNRSFGIGRSSVDIHVTAPRGSTADLHSGSGNIMVDGELGAVTGKAGSGDISVASCSDARFKAGSGSIKVQQCADVSASTGSGDITVGRADGRADLDTGSGDIDVTASVASGKASTGSGDVNVASVGSSFEVKTASGDITVGRAVEGELQVKAASGDVAVGIASGTAAHLDVSTVSGRVRSELDEADGPADTDRKLRLSARTVSGTITLERRP